MREDSILSYEAMAHTIAVLTEAMALFRAAHPELFLDMEAPENISPDQSVGE